MPTVVLRSLLKTLPARMMQGQVFAISEPRVGSRRTHQTSPPRLYHGSCTISDLSVRASNELSISATSLETFAAWQTRTRCSSRCRSLSAIAAATYRERRLGGTRRRNSTAKSWGSVKVSFLLTIAKLPYHQSAAERKMPLYHGQSMRRALAFTPLHQCRELARNRRRHGNWCARRPALGRRPRANTRDSRAAAPVGACWGAATGGDQVEKVRR